MMKVKTMKKNEANNDEEFKELVEYCTLLSGALIIYHLRFGLSLQDLLDNILSCWKDITKTIGSDILLRKRFMSEISSKLYKKIIDGKKNKNGWTSIEINPSEKGEYIVILNYHDGHIGHAIFDGKWFPHENECLIFDKSNISHYIKIPEAPKKLNRKVYKINNFNND